MIVDLLISKVISRVSVSNSSVVDSQGLLGSLK